MTPDQITIIIILLSTMGLFIWGRWRHDMVAGAALLACLAAGLVPTDAAFSGFGHPAVITVACVLILSQGLQNTGAVDALAQRVLPSGGHPTFAIGAITALAAVLSGFMNNVGALALLMPVAIQMAGRLDIPPGRVLMPMAFGSILGGTMTLVGTPPNMIVSGFRADAGLGSFTMFDFTPVGAALAATGVVFVGLLGWRLVPARRQADSGSFDTGKYLTEVRVPGDSKSIGKTLREVEITLDKSDAQIVGLVRSEVKVIAPYSRRVLRENDILVIEAEPESLSSALSSVGLKLEEEVPVSAEKEEEEPEEEVSAEAEQKVGSRSRSAERSRKNSRATAARDRKSDGAEEDGERDSDDGARTVTRDELVLQELVTMPDSPLVGRSASDIELRTRYGINLLAVSRQGRRSVKRLRSTKVRASDVLLMQGVPEAIASFASDYSCIPLATRDIRVPDKRQAIIAGIVMMMAIGAAAVGMAPVAISFAAGVLAFMVLRIVPPRSVYQAVDWPVIVLLGAMLPVAGAMASTGTADVLAGTLLGWVAQGNPVVALVLIMVVTMTLSDFMNNAATAAVMSPLSISVANQLGVNPDSFLMAVAIGASCAFLTPIGHQNNTLILGPGGFRFGDYWRLGLPLEMLVVLVSVPVLLVVWPL